MKNLNVVMHSFSTEPYKPLLLCASSPSLLLYEDRSPRHVRWLDCTTLPPKPPSGRSITSTNTEDKYWDLCVVEHGDIELLVVVYSDNRVDAYNLDADKLQWATSIPELEKPVRICAITTDGRGQLFATDPRNRCVHVLSTDGTYIGVLIKQGEQGLGKPMFSYWSSKYSSLIVFHGKGREDRISVIKLG